MAEFTPINTQEELDKVIASRLQRERDTVGKQYQAQLDEQTQKVTGYETQIEGLNKQIETLNSQVKEIDGLKSQIRAYETSSVKMRIAREMGLPYELAERLTGDDEKAIREDAESLGKLIRRQSGPAPLFTPEPEASGKDARLKNLLAELKNR